MTPIHKKCQLKSKFRVDENYFPVMINPILDFACEIDPIVSEWWCCALDCNSKCINNRLRFFLDKQNFPFLSV